MQILRLTHGHQYNQKEIKCRFKYNTKPLRAVSHHKLTEVSSGQSLALSWEGKLFHYLSKKKKKKDEEQC